MSRVSPTKRRIKIKQARHRREKISRLRQRYLAAKSSLEKEKIWEKVKKVAPWLSEKEFASPLKQKTK